MQLCNSLTSWVVGTEMCLHLVVVGTEMCLYLVVVGTEMCLYLVVVDRGGALSIVGSGFWWPPSSRVC